MDNIYVWEGHSSQSINYESLPITSGEDLFNKSRIKVPEKYRFITFHFNDTPTTADFTGPFILYGLKDIKLDDINSLFINDQCQQSTLELNTFTQVVCKNDRDANILKFKRKMFKSFVINYIDFISSNNYYNTQTYIFSKNLKKKSIFESSKSIIEYFTNIVNNNFNKICELYKINIDNYTITGSISTSDIFDSIINSKGDDFYNLLNLFKLNDLLAYFPEKNYNRIINEYKREYNKYKKKNNETLEQYYKINLINKIINEYKTDYIKYINKNEKLEKYCETNLTNKLREYYETGSIQVQEFGRLKNISLVDRLNYILKENKITKRIIKNNMKNKMINILKNIILLDNKIIDNYKRIENINHIILDPDLINEFYFNFFVLLLNKHIKTIQNDNLGEILNYLYLDNILYNKEEKKKLIENPWFKQGENEESNAITNMLKPIRTLKDSIDKFDQDLIDRICIHFKFNIRSYASNILTPILSFSDVLSFRNKTNNNQVKWKTYKYGFFQLENYQLLNELCHKIYDTEPERNIDNGLSKYSSEKQIPSRLYFYDETYTVNREELDNVKYYFNFFRKTLFQEDHFNYITDNNLDNIMNDEVLEYILLDIYDYIKKDINNYIKDINNYIEEINTQYNNDLIDKIINEDNLNNRIIIIDKDIQEKINNHNFNSKKLNEYDIYQQSNDKLYWFYECYHNILLLLQSNPNTKSQVEFNKFKSDMLFVIEFYYRINHNFFNHTDPGTYIIPSCGSFSYELKKVYESLDYNPIKLQKPDELKKESINEQDKITRALLKREQTKFNNRTIEYDTYWKNKYLKYKQKYFYLKNKKNNILYKKIDINN